MIIAGGLTLIAGAILYGSGSIARANNPSYDGHEQFLAWFLFIAGFVQIGFEVLMILNAVL